MSYHQHHHLPCPFFSYPYSSLRKIKTNYHQDHSLSVDLLICIRSFHNNKSSKAKWPFQYWKLWFFIRCPDSLQTPQGLWWTGHHDLPERMSLVSGWLWWMRAVNPMVYIDLYSIYHGLSGFAIRFFLGSCHFEGKACVYYHIYIYIYIYGIIYIYMCVCGVS